MEVAMPGPLALDCEDMFKEITKKLYGEEGALDFPDRVTDHEEGSLLKPEDHITAFGLAALMQNGFPPPGILHANFQPKTNPAAEDKWTATDEALQWTASRIASYNPAQKLFKCVDCECVGFLSRIAEHWLGTHSNARVFQCPQCAYGSAWARCVRLHLVREHNMPDDRGTDALVKNNPVLDEVTKYLQRLKAKVDSVSPPPPPAAAGRAPSGSPPAGTPGAVAVQGAAKRYGCPACPYATDRRDLFTRHENIHRDEKPFECYVCQKQFNRADHVKKHFLRMHRDHPYDLNRIRRQITKTSGNYYPKVTPEMNTQQNQPEQSYAPRIQHVKIEHNMHQIKAEHDSNALGKNAGNKKKGEKRYSCCYCPWSGVDNWCLKRHLNTHLKPFVCALCDYKAARSERLSTHVSKVHNKKACGKCSFLAEDQAQLSIHLQEQHHVENRSIKVPNTMVRAGYSGAPVAPVMPSFGPSSDGGSLEPVRVWRPPRQQGAARLFNYMEASDGSDQDDFPGGVNVRGHASYPHPQERNVQDFPKAGDVGNSAEDTGERDPTAAHGATVTSPAENSKHSIDKKKKVQKSKKSHNKENKASKFGCNICSLAFKTAGSLAVHQRRHANNSMLRSPLLAANGASSHFQFDNALASSTSDSVMSSSQTAWESDEENTQLRRSRKQSQPKKVIQTDGIEDGCMREKDAITECKTAALGNQIDHIIFKIAGKSSNVDSFYDTSSQRSLFAETGFHQSKNFNAIQKDNKSIKMKKKSVRRKLIAKFLLKKLRNKSPYIIFRCKRCRLKFNNKYEIYLHNKNCKKRRIK